MFSGGEKNFYFCFFIGSDITATLAEKHTILPVSIKPYATGA
jgi:hypothetical protein